MPTSRSRTRAARAWKRSNAVAEWPEVIACELMTGAADYRIKVVTTDVQNYDRFLRNTLFTIGLVTDSQSRIVVSTIRDTSRLPLPDEPEG